MPTHTEDIELATFGESMLRLSPPDSHRLEVSDELELYVAGAESNVAVTADRLGIQSTWISKLPDTALGRRVTNALHELDVETEVVWSDTGRQGVYFVELGPSPRGTNVIYDRDDASIRSAVPEELPLDTIRSVDAFYTSGITPALSDTLQGTTETLLSEAAYAGTTTILDVNYRSKLWSPDEAQEGIEPLLQYLDVLIIPDRDAEAVFNVSQPADEQAHYFANEYDIPTVIITRGEQGSLALQNGEIYKRASFETETVDAVGTGDAFTGGFLAQFLRGTDIESSLEYGNAAAALKRTIPGDMAIIDPHEVERLVESDSKTMNR